jgi:predicted RNase H-like HicB family nuclease
MQLSYHAAYFKQPDGWYFVEMLDFPAVFSQGKTLKSARWMIRDALKLMAEVLVEKGESLPRPNPKAKARRAAKADFQESIRLNTRFQTAAIR